MRHVFRCRAQTGLHGTSVPLLAEVACFGQALITVRAVALSGWGWPPRYFSPAIADVTGIATDVSTS